MTEHTDLVLLGRVHTSMKPILTLAVLAHSGNDFINYDTPLGHASGTYDTETLFKNHLSALENLFVDGTHVRTTVPMLVRYSASEEGEDVLITEIRPLSEKTLHQIVQFAWAKED